MFFIRKKTNFKLYKAFHKNVLIDDYNKYTNYFDETPSAMAWSGLRDNNVKAWVGLPAEKKAAIEALANRVPKLSTIAPCPTPPTN